MHGSHPATDQPRTKLLRVRLTADEHSRLRTLALRQERPMAEIVRSALAFTAFAAKEGATRHA